jgi:hypothetical protein
MKVLSKKVSTCRVHFLACGFNYFLEVLQHHQPCTSRVGQMTEQILFTIFTMAVFSANEVIEETRDQNRKAWWVGFC